MAMFTIFGASSSDGRETGICVYNFANECFTLFQIFIFYFFLFIVLAFVIEVLVVHFTWMRYPPKLVCFSSTIISFPGYLQLIVSMALESCWENVCWCSCNYFWQELVVGALGHCHHWSTCYLTRTCRCRCRAHTMYVHPASLNMKMFCHWRCSCAENTGDAWQGRGGMIRFKNGRLI